MKNSFHLLLVEDDPDDIDLLKTSFQDNNIECNIDVIIDGSLALPWLAKAKKLPDIIVLDLNLPKVHGREILSKIKSDTLFEKIPVVILTTSSSKEDMEYCLKEGAEKFITKPTTIDGFNDAVSTIVMVASSVK